MQMQSCGMRCKVEGTGELMELELKEYFRIIRKRIWLIASFVAVAAILTAIVSYFFLKPVYSASTKVIVNKSSDPSAGIQTLDLSTVNLNIRLINTYKEIIKTTGIMDKVAERYPEFGLTGEQLIHKVRVSSVNDTQVMTLTVEDRSHETAVKMVNAITEVFMEQIPAIMSVDNVTILSPAKLLDNPVPIKPNPELNIAISIVVALMLALGVVFLLEYLDDTIKTERDAELVLGVPLLATIGRIKPEEMREGQTAEATARLKAGETYVSVKQ
jgi:capsular polysaccharide biosynthesis protein